MTNTRLVLLENPPGVDVPDHVVLEDGHAVVHVRPAFAVREAVPETPESQALRLLPLLALHVLPPIAPPAVSQSNATRTCNHCFLERGRRAALHRMRDSSYSVLAHTRQASGTHGTRPRAGIAMAGY